ncbi:MAG: hypothetical protein ACLVAW_17270 [Eisenbergiella massiliensis]
MTDKLMECITNPVKCKLLLEIYSQGQATAKHLSDKYTDIPPATLYRHLKRMLHDGILKVVEETQVRGTVERTYALAQNINSIWKKYWKKLRRTLYQYFMQIYHGLCQTISTVLPVPNINIKEDMTGFSLSPLYLSDEELTALVTEISKTISAVKNNEPNAERKLRTIGVIISPAEKLDN